MVCNTDYPYIQVRVGEAAPDTIACLDGHIGVSITLHDICINGGRTPQASELGRV